MFKTVSTLLYSAQLALTLSMTVLQLAWLKVPYMIRLCSVYTLICILTTSLVVTTVPAQSSTRLHQTTLPPHPELLSHATSTRPELETKLLQYKQLLQKQPQHRDLLINAALVAQALGEEEEFQKYWQKAQEIDPNYHLFD